MMLMDRILKKRHHDDHERSKQHGSHMEDLNGCRIEL